MSSCVGFLLLTALAHSQSTQPAEPLAITSQGALPTAELWKPYSLRPPNQIKKKLVLTVAIPLTTEWERKARVNGNRIDGSIKVSNRTGRDFDLTVIVLAVNDIGRATAIGYQHFPLKQSTRDMEIPFGDTLSPGNYAVNVDVLGEEPVSNRIFRARLVTGKEQITQGP